jgi:transcription elongation GreA/GreB family factor
MAGIAVNNDLSGHDLTLGHAAAAVEGTPVGTVSRDQRPEAKAMAPVSDTSEPNPTGGTSLDAELARLRTDRRTLAADLAGEDPEAPVVGDSGDQAQALEGDDDLARIDRRISEVQRLASDPDATKSPAGIADGTVVTLRFPGGDLSTFRVVTIAEQAGTDEEVLTSDSPLGRALAGHGQGDTLTYEGPDGELSVEVVELRAPTG